MRKKYEDDAEYQRALESLDPREIDRLIDVYYALEPEKRQIYLDGLARFEANGTLEPGTAERVKFNIKPYVNPAEPRLLQIYDAFEASELKMQYDALPTGKPRTDFRKAHPEFDAQLKALGYVKGDD